MSGTVSEPWDMSNSDTPTPLSLIWIIPARISNDTLSKVLCLTLGGTSHMTKAGVMSFTGQSTPPMVIATPSVKPEPETMTMFPPAPEVNTLISHQMLQLSSEKQSPGPCLTTATWRCRKNFSQWEGSFLWKLCCHWLKGLRQRQIAVLRQTQGFSKVSPSVLVRPIKSMEFHNEFTYQIQVQSNQRFVCEYAKIAWPIRGEEMAEIQI